VTVGENSVELDGERVRVSRGGVEVASGRWYAGRIVDRVGAPGDPEEAAWGAIEAAVHDDSEAFVQATSGAAYDARGVDVTQIDRMLALTPRERLRMLETHCRSILRLLGDEPPH
jgi:hypothetical protein